ncbi:hypothetical protein [Pseudomonas sp. Irchel s3h9]|uniref:phage tail fiber protein n=1 Tax=Pseudomonas sp. Irchel s3h9 TaxID=2009192 RepID=UPI000BA4C6B5|nr:hypothetical protein [Pseudomonas sp. Irchel s3h9]
MPWYKTGTVSVTQNSNAVIGAGTAFIANSRVGDGFRGPDGRWYEVTNIASNTALSISPNYEGPTAADGFYAIMPVQGYQKDLSDQVRAILNDYGEKLAALGTTGNYDILPPSKGGTGITDLSVFIEGLLNDADAPAARTTLGAAKSGANADITSLTGLTTAVPVSMGGTGGTDQAGARTGLGLGSVAVENIVPVTKGGTGGASQATARSGLGLGTAAVAAIGTAAGQVPVVGNFGVGDVSITNASWNNSLRTGFSSYSGTATGGPTFNGGNWFANGIDVVYGVDPTVKTQLAIRVNSSDFAMRSLNMNLASASSWVYFWNTGNTTVDGSGFIKKASPIVRITNPVKSTRPDLKDGFFEAGYGTVNEEAFGVTVERLELGRYLIRGSMGLAKSGWQVNSPSDRNGGKLFGLAVGEDLTDGTILIEFRKIKYALTDEGELEQVHGELVEAPVDNWIDVRVDMPAP